MEKPPRSRSPKTKPLHGGFTRGKSLVGGVVEKPTEDKTIVVAKPRSRSRSPQKPVGSGDLGGTTDKKTKKLKEDTGGENTKRRGRSKSKALQPLVRATSQKRIITKESTDAPAKAKAKAEQKGFDEKKIMSELKKAIKAEEKATAASSGAASSGAA